MIKRVVIHAGHFKTGTTSVQAILSRHRQLLSTYGFLYPDWGSDQHSERLFFWRDDTRISNERFWVDYQGEAKAAPEETLLLSGETISSYRREDFERLRRLFPGLPIHLVICLRHWSGFLPSRWRQNVRRSDSLPFTAFLRAVSEDYLRTIDGDFGLIAHRAMGCVDVMGLTYYSQADGVGDVLRMMVGNDELTAQLLAIPTRVNAADDFVSLEFNRLFNEIANGLLSRPQDLRYTTLRDGQSLRYPLDLGPSSAAFRAQGTEMSLRLEALVEGSRQSLRVRDSGLPLHEWTEKLTSDLAAIGLSTPPNWWGDGESDNAVDFTELQVRDLDADLGRALAAAVQECPTAGIA